MTDRVLTPRDLNRTLLRRQLLLERAEAPALDAVRRLVGLQAQVPNPPYTGLWTRLEGFRREDLTRLIEEQRVVRAALMRSTLHLMAAEDYPLLWPAIQPALARAMNSFFGKQARGLDVERLVAVARERLAEGPKTSAELRAVLSEVEPDRDPAALAYAVRSHLPLVQVPPGGTWRSGGSPAYALVGIPAEDPDPREGLRELVFRYLAAFGPATVKDFQAWSGLVRMGEAFGGFRPELRVYKDEAGNELFDLPDAPLPSGDEPAAVRFVPEYDNLVLSHADRRRILADEHRKGVFLSAARVRATFLVDGFVRGAWKVEKAGRTATLVVEPFEPLSARDREALAEEGERLIRFIEDGAEGVGIRFANDP